MLIDKKKKIENRIKRLSKYIVLSGKVDFPISLEELVQSARERGDIMVWVDKKVKKLTKEFLIFHGIDENSLRQYWKYYNFIWGLIMTFMDDFEKEINN